MMLLDIGISVYTQTLRQFAKFMGWEDHDIENWFLPVHLAIQHIRTPEDVPCLPSVQRDARYAQTSKLPLCNALHLFPIYPGCWN